MHESSSAVYLHAVVRDFVGDFRTVRFRHRREDGSGLVVEFLFISDILRKFGDRRRLHQMRVALAQVNHFSRFVQESPSRDDLEFHPRQHIVYRWEFVNWALELLSLSSVFTGFGVGRLGDTQSLSGNRDASAVHKGHDVFGQSSFSQSAKFSRNAVVLEFASSDTMNSVFVLDTSYDEFRA